MATDNVPAKLFVPINPVMTTVDDDSIPGQATVRVARLGADPLTIVPIARERLGAVEVSRRN